MKSKALYLTFLPAFLFATNIQSIVDSTFEKNYELKSIEQSIKIASQDIKLSSKYQNPNLTFGVNDIYFDEPFTRDKEAMQASYIGISQTFESVDKLRLKEQVSKKSKRVQELILEDKKARLQALIYKKSWDILVFNEQKNLLNEYLKNLEKINLLNENYYETGTSNQNDILDINIKKHETQLKINSLENKRKNLFVDLKSISYLDIKSIDDKLNFNAQNLNIDIQNHPKIEILNEQIKQQNIKAKLEEEKKFSDFKVSAVYFSRDSRFKDYANISVSIPLGINETENMEIVKAKLKASKLKNQKQNIIESFNLKLKTLENDMSFSRKNIELIQDKIIPLNETIQSNIENYISLNKENYKKLILNLNNLLDLKMKVNQYKKEYFNSKAELIYLSQGLNNGKK